MPVLVYYTTEEAIRERWASAKKAEREQILGFIDRATSRKPYCDNPIAHYQLCLCRFENRQQLTASLVLQDAKSPLFDPAVHGGVTARVMREILGLAPRVKPLVLQKPEPKKPEPKKPEPKKPEPKKLVLKPAAKALPPLQLKKPAVKPLVLPKKKPSPPPLKLTPKAPF